MTRYIVLALPCNGNTDLECIQDFIKSTGMVHTDWTFDVIPEEKEADAVDAINELAVTNINPVEVANDEFYKDEN